MRSFTKINLSNMKININKWKKKLSSLKFLPYEYSENNKKLYTIYDTLNHEFLYNNLPGEYPFIRGIYSSMYTTRVWTIRQYAGFGNSTETNLFYKKCLKSGQKGLSIAFDLPTHRGLDSNNYLSTGDVGKTGVAIDTVEDMKVLLAHIPLDSVSVSMTMNGAVLPILASFIVASEEMGFSKEKLMGTIQNDILKEFIVRNTYIYTPEHSMRIVGDILYYVTKNMPKFHPISISGYHFQETGAYPSLEVGLALANGLEYINLGKSYNLNIDEFAPHLSFFFGIGMNFLQEIAKLRAARWLWSNIVKQFNPNNPKSSLLKTHCQTSGWSLSSIEPYNNIVRTTIEAMAAVLGGTQSLHTNSFDEALALPTEESSRIARNTQLIIQHETDLPNVIDPIGGSYYVEYLTKKIYLESLHFLQDIEMKGGALNALKNGVQKKWILESAIKTQALIDSEDKKIVGSNYLKSNVKDSHVYSLKLINSKNIQDSQKMNIKYIKKHRNFSIVQNSLNNLKRAAEKSENLLEKSIDAIKCRATVGEVSDTLGEVYGKHTSNGLTFPNVYQLNLTNKYNFKRISQKVKALSVSLGRTPRILMTKIGQDGHDRGIICVSSALADLGFDIDLLPLFSSIDQIVKCAINNDVHMIGISSLAGSYMETLPILIENLCNAGGGNISIALGGIIQKQEYNKLFDIGVSSIYSPGQKILDIAEKLLQHITKRNNDYI